MLGRQRNRQDKVVKEIANTGRGYHFSFSLSRIVCRIESIVESITRVKLKFASVSVVLERD